MSQTATKLSAMGSISIHAYAVNTIIWVWTQWADWISFWWSRAAFCEKSSWIRIFFLFTLDFRCPNTLDWFFFMKVCIRKYLSCLTNSSNAFFTVDNILTFSNLSDFCHWVYLTGSFSTVSNSLF